MPSSTTIPVRFSLSSDWAPNLRLGGVTGISVADPVGFALESIGSELGLKDALGESDLGRIVTCEVPVNVEHLRVIRMLVEQLANAALYLWPDWFGGVASLVGQANENESESILSEINEFRVHNAGLRIDPTWFRAAMRLCLKGHPPVTNDDNLTIQVRQLAACLRGSDLFIAVVVPDTHWAAEELLSISKAAEWLAKETNSKVLLVVPRRLETAAPLSSIRFFRADPAASVAQCGGEGARPTSDERDTSDSKTAVSQRRCEQKHTVQPIIGRPHPGSLGEQILARLLANDSELYGLFQFNQPVETTRGPRYLVDLIWPAGKVVVEVDGFRHHSSQQSFSADRRRDYELLISGIVVLRLPHDEVIDDPEVAIEKIRDVVRWRKSFRSVSHAE